MTKANNNQLLNIIQNPKINFINPNDSWFQNSKGNKNLGEEKTTTF